MPFFAARRPAPSARQADEATRVRLAARATTSAATLHILAQDPAVTVRAAVAMNPVYAPEAARHLMTDKDDRVRALLADKVARLLPGLSGQEHRLAYDHVHSTLLALAGDTAIRVRLAITDVLHTMPEAPRAVILKLAQDPVLAVSDPVMRLSPLLTDIDLLELLATPPHPGTAQAVATRGSLSHAISATIAAQADSVAIRILLQNATATIQEGTLDALIGRAGDHPEWHEPLIRRPRLLERAARALSTIVTGQILDELLSRTDLPPSLVAEFGSRVTAAMLPTAPVTDEEALGRVQQLKEAGQLGEAHLVQAAEAGDCQQARAVLAIASGVTIGMLDRAVALRSAKALVSVVWRAGFGMSTAVLIQSVLGQLSPAEILIASQLGEFPLSTDEMEWQIELLAEPGV